MSFGMVKIRELAGWGLDDYEYRAQVFAHEKLAEAKLLVAGRPTFEQPSVLSATPETTLGDMLAVHAGRPDLLAEMSGLSWSLGIVDLRFLIAFQRRLTFRSEAPPLSIPAGNDWPALIALSFGSAKPIECELIHDHSTRTVTIRSSNPNLHIRTTNDAASPLSIQNSGPFFEVACFRDRWFLRDGYHRAYDLMRAGVFEVPAVVIQVSNLEDLGAAQPWFFPEEVLFSETPPRVADFLNDDLVIEYERPPLIKTLRITLEETLGPATPIGEPS
jgi:hypothetical protein